MQNVCNFFFELAQLRRIKHEGWRLIGVEFPESVAEHSLRAAQIGYCLAKLEGYSKPERVSTILIFHDIGECRTGDIHRVAKRYIQSNEGGAVRAQMEKLGDMGKNIFSLWKEMEYGESKAGILAKDADFLDMAVTAREYIERGYTGAQDWINNISKALQTNSAKKLLKLLIKSNSLIWWKNLKKV